MDDHVMQISRYSLYEDRLPERIRPDVARYLFAIRGAMHESGLEEVSSVVAYTRVSWMRRPESVDLYTFGAFNSPFAVVDHMAEALVPVYLETIILPINQATRLARVAQATGR
jgi:hypothetical protein